MHCKHYISTVMHKTDYSAFNTVHQLNTVTVHGSSLSSVCFPVKIKHHCLQNEQETRAKSTQNHAMRNLSVSAVNTANWNSPLLVLGTWSYY